MKSALQRIFAVFLGLTLAPWAQGEICPMKMQAQQAEACRTPSMHAHHAAQAAAKPGERDCCPPEQVHHAPVRQQRLPVQLTACDSTMTCCSIEQQPSSSPQSSAIPQQPVVVSVVDVSLRIPVRTVGVVSNLKISFESSVFRQKEDLRI